MPICFTTKNSRGEEVKHTMQFNNGLMKVWEMQGQNENAFNTQIENGNLIVFKSGQKVKTYKLNAAFAGPRKAELNSRYDLNMQGDDVKGWTLVLSKKAANSANPVKSSKAYPKTGDSENITLFVAMLIASIMTIVVLSYKKKRTN